MRDFSSSSPAVVVGIDGSRSTVAAALWAVDEGGVAISRCALGAPLPRTTHPAQVLGTPLGT